VNARLRGGDAGILLWERGGEIVSLAGWGGPTPNGCRVGPVIGYTRVAESAEVAFDPV
jgi:hypothetical protein